MELVKPTILKFEENVTSIKKLTHDVKEIVIHKPEGFSFIPGQFITLLLEKEGAEFRRSYSIASKDNTGPIELCIKILKEGQGTSLIDNWNVGEKVRAIGPLGKFILHEHSRDKPIIFISTGTGVTPFRPMIHHILHHAFGRKIDLIAGYRDEEDVLYDEEFKNSRNERFSYHQVFSRSENKEKMHVQDMLEKIFNPDADYYICGLKEMVLSVRELLLQKGVSIEQIFFERYD
jgi:CDP-4-dehydro-6-deoxyglucose reductase